jgi:hypothetical protein
MPHMCVQVHRYTLRNCEIQIAGGRRIERIAERIAMLTPHVQPTPFAGLDFVEL